MNERQAQLAGVLTQHAAQSGCLAFRWPRSPRPTAPRLRQGWERVRRLLGVLRRATASQRPGCFPARAPEGRSARSPTRRGPWCACPLGGGCVTKSCDSLSPRGVSQSPELWPSTRYHVWASPPRPSGWADTIATSEVQQLGPCGGFKRTDGVRRSVHRHRPPGETWLVPISSGCYQIDYSRNPSRVSGGDAHRGVMLERMAIGEAAQIFPALGHVPLPSCHAHPGEPQSKRRRGWRAPPRPSLLLIYCRPLLAFLLCVREGRK